MSDNTNVVHQMPDRFAVLARSAPGGSGQLGNWYDEVHIPEVLEAFPGIVAARRYDLVERLVVGGDLLDSYHSLAVYRTDGPAQDLWDVIRRSRDLGTSPLLDYRSVTALFG